MTEATHTALSATGEQYLALRTAITSQDGIRQMLPELRRREKAKLFSLLRFENPDPDVAQQIQMAVKTKIFVDELFDDPNEFRHIPSFTQIMDRLSSTPSFDLYTAFALFKGFASACGHPDLGPTRIDPSIYATSDEAHARRFFNSYMGRITDEMAHQIYSIEIWNPRIQGIPHGFLNRCDRLRKVSIKNSQITAIPKEIAKLPLSSLKLICPSMETLPQVFLEIPTLVELGVHENLQISSISTALFKRLRADNSKANYTILRKCRDDYMLNSADGAARLWLVNPESELLDDNMDLPPALRNKTFRCFLSWLICLITLGMSKNIPNPIAYSRRLR